MKKFTLLLAGFILIGSHLNAQDVIAGWTFPGSSAEADTGIVENIGNEIYTIGGTSGIEFKNGFETKAAQASSWNNGTETKGWVIPVNTEGYEAITISSKQSSGGNDPGPKYYKLKFSLDAGTSWTDLQEGEITVENDWETGVINNIALPIECDNQAEVLVCWMMASEEASGSGGNVLGSGKSKIDDIFIHGDKISYVNDYSALKVKVGPNPAIDYIMIRAEVIIEEISLLDNSGRIIKSLKPSSAQVMLNIAEIPKGLYLVLVKIDDNIEPSCHKILIK